MPHNACHLSTGSLWKLLFHFLSFPRLTFPLCTIYPCLFLLLSIWFYFSSVFPCLLPPKPHAIPYPQYHLVLFFPRTHLTFHCLPRYHPLKDCIPFSFSLCLSFHPSKAPSLLLSYAFGIIRPVYSRSPPTWFACRWNEPIKHHNGSRCPCLSWCHQRWPWKQGIRRQAAGGGSELNLWLNWRNISTQMWSVPPVSNPSKHWVRALDVNINQHRS